MPPSVPGLRLKETFEEGLSKKGDYSLIKKKIASCVQDENGDFILHTDESGLGMETIKAKAALLATGRFTGKGLHAGRKKITEAVFNLPVVQPECRSHWLQKDFLAPEGHPINRAGIEIDSNFRPKFNNGKPLYSNLFAAGSILAHQDWKRMKCGTGLAVATSFAAVNALIKLNKNFD
jgi:glycerol-3-phosphate dehydrogenase subunit B